MSTVDVMQSSQKLTSQQLRKIKKPIIEKRRRERINESLNQLKTLVLEALEKDESQYSKMEKADILEMTVKHLKNLQSRLSCAKGLVTSQPSTNNSVVVNKYKAGFKECAKEVNRYLSTVPTVHPGIKEHLNGHLSSCSSTLESCTLESSVPQQRDIPMDQNGSSATPDSINSGSICAERSLPIAGVQIGIPVINSNGSSSLVLSSPVSPMHTQGYVPVLISPNTTGSGSIGSGISVVSPQNVSPSTAVPGGVIPLYSSSHLLHSGTQSPSHDSESSVYSSPRSSPIGSPVSSVSDGRPSVMQLDFSHSKGGSYTQDAVVASSHPRMVQDFKRSFENDSCGQDMYKYSKEMLIQPSAGHVWRPW